MIPYETIRSHLERRHWLATDEASWPERLVIHEEEHRAGRDHHTDLPPVTTTPAARVTR